MSTARSQHPEYCRRCRSHGGGCRVGLWHQPTSHDRFFVSVTILLQLFIPYHRYVFILKGLTVSLLAYAAVLFTVHVPWEQVATHTVWPKITLDSSTAAMVVGVFGTTISPYFFSGRPQKKSKTWKRTQAASALRPLAGDFAYMFFALGILDVGMIGVPVLAGSGAYALSEAMGWRKGLERKVNDARGFYAIISVSVLAGLGIQYSPISPMKALFWSAVINGLVAVPLMAVIIILVSKKSVMGAFTASRPLLVLGWITTAVMRAAAVGRFIPG